MPLSTGLHLGVKRHRSVYAYIRVSKIILYICPHQGFQRAAIYMPMFGSKMCIYKGLLNIQ
jgi:hypothetical protein